MHSKSILSIATYFGFGFFEPALVAVEDRVLAVPSAGEAGFTLLTSEETGVTFRNEFERRIRREKP